MASNGLEKTAIQGKCRICQRVRNTSRYLKAVGEVKHGFATGHIWECKNTVECDAKAAEKLEASGEGSQLHDKISLQLSIGRYKEYKIVN